MYRSSVQEPALSQPGNEMSEKNYWLMAADQILILGPMCSDVQTILPKAIVCWLATYCLGVDLGSPLNCEDDVK
jgi:hypothetical protein